MAGRLPLAQLITLALVRLRGWRFGRFFGKLLIIGEIREETVGSLLQGYRVIDLYTLLLKLARLVRQKLPFQIVRGHYYLLLMRNGQLLDFATEVVYLYCCTLTFSECYDGLSMFLNLSYN